MKRGLQLYIFNLAVFSFQCAAFIKDKGDCFGCSEVARWILCCSWVGPRKKKTTFSHKKRSHGQLVPPSEKKYLTKSYPMNKHPGEINSYIH